MKLIKSNLPFIIPIAAWIAWTMVVAIWLDGRFQHVWERQPGHIVGGVAVCLLLAFIWNECVRKGLTYPVGPVLYWFGPILLTGLFVFLREPSDAGHAGGTGWWKSYADLPSWWLGAALGAWARYRLCAVDNAMRKSWLKRNQA